VRRFMSEAAASGFVVNHFTPNVAVSPNGNYAIGIANFTYVNVSDAVTHQSRRWVAHAENITAVRFSPDGERIVTTSRDKTARIWNVKDGTPVTPSLPHNGIVTSARFGADGLAVVTVCKDKTVRVWDARTGQAISSPFAEHRSTIIQAFFSQDGEWVITVGTDGTVMSWKFREGRSVRIRR